MYSNCPQKCSLKIVSEISTYFASSKNFQQTLLALALPRLRYSIYKGYKPDYDLLLTG